MYGGVRGQMLARWRVNASDLLYDTGERNTGPATDFNEEKTSRDVSRPNDSHYRHPVIHGNP